MLWLQQGEQGEHYMKEYHSDSDQSKLKIITEKRHRHLELALTQLKHSTQTNMVKICLNSKFRYT